MALTAMAHDARWRVTQVAKNQFLDPKPFAAFLASIPLDDLARLEVGPVSHREKILEVVEATLPAE